MMAFLSIVVAILFLGFLIFIHEWSHFIIARKGGVKVPVFSIGFGPAIVKWKRGETEYKIGAFPIGGYVKLHGMEPGEIKGEPDEFYSRPAWIRVMIVLGGPIANLLLGFIIYLGTIGIMGIETPATTLVQPDSSSVFQKFDRILSVNGEKVEDWFDVQNKFTDTSIVVVIRGGKLETLVVSVDELLHISPLFPPVVGGIEKDGPAARAGIEMGDSIIEINGKRVQTWDEMRNIILSSPGESLKVVWKSVKDGIKTGIVVPEETKTMQGDSTVTVGMIGIMTPNRIRRVGSGLTFKLSWYQFEDTALKIFKVFGMLIKRKVSPRELGGPIAIVYLTGRSLKWGVKNLIYFIAFITINLGIVNLIPIPPLDGAHALLGIIEMITRRKPGERSLKILENIGFFILIFLFLFITFNDLFRFFTGKMH